MVAKDYFFRLSYEQYLNKKPEERKKWEPEVLLSVMEKVKGEMSIETPCLDAFLKNINEEELSHSNSFVINKLVDDILKREENEKIVLILNNCWVANRDLPDSKNACVVKEQFYDGSHLVMINTEFIINLSRIAWLYTTILLLEDITPYADFRDSVSLNVLKNKFASDLKNDTDEGSEYLMECFLTFDTKRILNEFVTTFYKAALVFILMHEVGHILELEEAICNHFGLLSSKTYDDLTYNEKRRIAEYNADKIGYKYSDEYIGVDSFFNMGPVLSILTLAINCRDIKQETDHPSLKNRYENVLYALFEGKEVGEILHTRKLLHEMCEILQGENCWSVDEEDWWKNRIGL